MGQRALHRRGTLQDTLALETRVGLLATTQIRSPWPSSDGRLFTLRSAMESWMRSDLSCSLHQFLDSVTTLVRKETVIATHVRKYPNSSREQKELSRIVQIHGSSYQSSFGCPLALHTDEQSFPKFSAGRQVTSDTSVAGAPTAAGFFFDCNDASLILQPETLVSAVYVADGPSGRIIGK